MRRYWTTVEITKLRYLYPNMENGEIGKLLGRSWSAVQTMAGKIGLKKSPAFMASPVCRWPKGHKTWNAGKKGWCAGGKAKLTQFKKDHRSPRQKLVGTERIERDGVYVKVAEPNVWEAKARVVWRKNFGQIPEGAIVRLKEKGNHSPESLMLVTRAEHMILNYRPRRPKQTPAWVVPIASLRLAA